MPTIPPIDTWTEGLLAIRQHAISLRGSIELDDGPKWPRTTGDDVVLIAALFDPSVRALRPTTAGVVRRWQAALDTIASTALTARADTYADNRNFWDTLAFVAVTLDEQAALVPSSTVWENLFSELGTTPRNASTPRGDALAVLAEMGNDLRAKRGTLPDVELAGVEGSGTSSAHTIPFLSNGDAVQLADYWSQWLAEIPNTDGDGILLRARWHDALDDVDALARPGGPGERYGESSELWAACAAVAAYISAASKAPSPRNAKRTKRDDADGEQAAPADDQAASDDAAADAQDADEPLEDAATDEPVPADDIEIDRDDPIEQFAARLFELRIERGADPLPAPAGWLEPLARVARIHSIPRLTNADAFQLTAEWSALLAGPLGQSPVMGTNSARAVLGEWRWAIYEVKRSAKGADSNALYEDRNRFVRALNNLAICLSAAYRIDQDEPPPSSPRNAAGSSGGWPAQRVDPLAVYIALVEKYRAERGAALRAPPPGFTGTTRAIPRTTNQDVLLLAAWCSDALAETPHVAGTTGNEIKQWADAVATVNLLAWQDDPDAVYPRNNEFWRSLAAVVTLMSATDDVRYGRAPVGMPRNAPPPPFGPFPGLSAYDDIANAQKTTLGKLRGEDQLAPPPGFTGQTIAIPRTTNADVLALAGWWSDRLAEAPSAIDTDGVSTSTIKAEWQAAIGDANTLAKGADPNAIYAKNNEFWRSLRHLSVQIASALAVPSTWDNALASLGYGVTHLPETLSNVAHKAEVAVEVIKATVWDSIKWPVYIGGGALGLYLVTRHHEER